MNTRTIERLEDDAIQLKTSLAIFTSELLPNATDKEVGALYDKLGTLMVNLYALKRQSFVCASAIQQRLSAVASATPKRNQA